MTSLTSVCIPDGVVSIGDNAFAECTGLKSAVIPDSANDIGQDIFDGCKSLTVRHLTDKI